MCKNNSIVNLQQSIEKYRLIFFVDFQYFDTLTSDPSNSNRALIFGCITIQTLFLVRQFVKITSQVRPARVELLTEVKNSYIIINHE